MALAKLVADKPLSQADRCALERRRKAVAKARKRMRRPAPPVEHSNSFADAYAALQRMGMR